MPDPKCLLKFNILWQIKLNDSSECEDWGELEVEAERNIINKKYQDSYHSFTSISEMSSSNNTTR